MRYQFRLYHPNQMYVMNWPDEENPDSIEAAYYISDEAEYERVKNTLIPLSKLPWYDPHTLDEENAYLKDISDEQYFQTQVKVKVVDIVQKLQFKWSKVLRSSKKALEVHLFASSPLLQGKDLAFCSTNREGIQVYISGELIENLLERNTYRIAIPDALTAQPEYDLQASLDFKMCKWKEGLMDNPPLTFVETWMHWLWKFRVRGLARLSALETGQDVEMNPKKIGRIMNEWIKNIEQEIDNGRPTLSAFKNFLDSKDELINQWAPQMMLRAINHFQLQNSCRNLEKALKKVNTTGLFHDQKITHKIHVAGKKLDFDQWLENILFTSEQVDPMIDPELFRALNQKLLALDGKKSILLKLVEQGSKQPDIFHLKGKKTSKSQASAVPEGIRMDIDLPVHEHFQLLAESWS
ncbi:hypothetical protein MMU07_03390 [Aquiflexum sp. LQ15W]|uniref:hypothetical protein n=1 Tax=Cognataquiflexum nitidum TaxID=2922272 RepID=UPI001F1340FC|nr:hypothetical protein [Cognataquiflexum nitidum]MCH6198609.1 hypothetical protein [Cognataquiflexum nitidum]